MRFALSYRDDVALTLGAHRHILRALIKVPSRAKNFQPDEFEVPSLPALLSFGEIFRVERSATTHERFRTQTFCACRRVCA